MCADFADGLNVMATRTQPLWTDKLPFRHGKSGSSMQRLSVPKGGFDSHWPKRELCNCQGKIHKIRGNCLACGRVLCELEVRDSRCCCFCDSPFGGSSDESRGKFLQGKANTQYNEALEQCSKLLSRDRSDATTQILDDNLGLESETLEENEIFLEISIDEHRRAHTKYSFGKVCS